MNEQMTSQMTEVLNSLQEEIAAGTELVKEQLPIVVQEILSWNLLCAKIWTGISGGFIILSVIYMICLWKNKRFKLWMKENGGLLNNNSGPFLTLFTPSFFWTITIPGFIVNLSAVIKISIAPRVFLIDYLKDMLN